MRYLVLLSLLYLTACGADISKLRTTTGSTSSSSALACNCPAGAGSVCGSDGRTYASACLAQCAGVNYDPGVCGVTNCDSNSGPVCGQPAYSCPDGMVCAQVMPAPVTYSNDCARVQAGASFVQTGNCPSNIIVEP